MVRFKIIVKPGNKNKAFSLGDKNIYFDYINE